MPSLTPTIALSPAATLTAVPTPTLAATATGTAPRTPTGTPLPPATIYYCVDGTLTCAAPGWARTIQEAIFGAIANAIQSVVPVIVVPPALYDERLTIGGNAAVRIVAGTSPGTLAFGGRTWEVRPMAARTTPDAPVVRPSNGGSVITIAAGSSLILEGFVLEGGTGTPMQIDVYNPDTGQTEQRTVNSGAGIVNNGALLLTGSRLTGNDAGQLGSIVYTAPGAVSTIDGGAISDNTGAALFNRGQTTVDDASLDGNRPRNTNCAVFNYPGAALAMTDASVTDTAGTGICNSGTLSLTRTAVDRNDQHGLFHANSDPNGSATLTVRKGSLSGNGSQGLLSWIIGNSPAELHDVEIADNRTEGVYRLAGTLTVSGGRIAGNRSGAIHNRAVDTCFFTGTETVCTGPDTRLTTLRDVEISGNSGNPAVRNSNSARLALVDVEITGNSIRDLIANAIVNGDSANTLPYIPAELTMTGGRIANNSGGVYAVFSNLGTTTLNGVSIQNTPTYAGYPAIVQLGGTFTMDGVSLDGGFSSVPNCWQRPCTDDLALSPLTIVRDSAFGGAEANQVVSIPYGTIERSAFTAATLQGGCELAVSDSTMTGSGVIGVCHVDGRPSIGRLAVSGTTIAGGWSGLWNLGVAVDISATITGAATGIYHSAGTTAIGPESRITRNVVGINNVSSDPGAVTGVNPTTVFDNETNCIGVAGCT
jgi:hypothetical protein